MDWAQKFVDYSLPILTGGLVAVAKWVHTMSMKIEEHDKRVHDIECEQEACRDVCHETRERIALSEQDRAHLHDAVHEIKGLVDKVLWHVKDLKNGG